MRVCGLGLYVFTGLVLAGALVGEVGAVTPEDQGRAIFDELERRNAGYEDYRVDLRMVLRNSAGDESERLLRIRQLEVPDDGDKLLIVFDTPKTIRGTALLSYGHKVATDDQWLYLPAIKRVKRIASKNKSGPFLGSEFAFEDLSNPEPEKYDYRFVREDDWDDKPCYVVERFPKDRYSGYTRQVVWINQAEYRIEKIEYYDRKLSLLKTLEVGGYERYTGSGYWKPAYMSMRNHQTGKSTELHWQGYQFRTGLMEERDFTTNSLKRVR